MIIGEALKRLFAGMTITVDAKPYNINFHYGDHKELIKWIQEKDKLGNVNKYPLVWYVIAPFEEFNGQVEVQSRLIIMMSTELFYDNNQRAVKTYDTFIEPVWQMIRKKLVQHPHINVWGENFNQFKIKDEPNYGVDITDIRLSQNDFTRKKQDGEQGISLDIVDGRVISLHMRLKPQCIT